MKCMTCMPLLLFNSATQKAGQGINRCIQSVYGAHIVKILCLRLDADWIVQRMNLASG